MQNLIHKWKKIINNEKTEFNDKADTIFIETNDSNHKENSLSNSVISERSNKFKTKTSSSRLNSSDKNFLRSSSNSSISKIKNEENRSIIESDKVIELLKATINLLNNNTNNNLIIDNLNEVIQLHVESINNQRLKRKSFEEKEIIWKTKCDTAEKMIKDLELKVLTLEKEKVN